jgi:hypothetical protein
MDREREGETCEGLAAHALEGATNHRESFVLAGRTVAAGVRASGAFRVPEFVTQ